MIKGVKVFNLFASDENIISKECEVCIVGAGAAGIYLAVNLASKGIDTILLEAGDIISTNSSDAGFEVNFEDELYSGATKGRYFGLGGTTTHWGGVLVPHSKYDARKEGNNTFDAWKHIIDIVDSKSKTVLKKLGWNREGGFTYFDNNKCQKLLKAAGINLVLDLSLPFRKKNLSYLLGRLSKSNSKLTIFINSVVCDWESSPGSCDEKIRNIKARSSNNKKLQIKANKFIVSAGAIESARILLELDQSSNRSIIKDTAAVGCYLTDHISLPVAKVDKGSSAKVIKSFSPYFSHGWMRNFRFIDYSSDCQIPRSFFHFIFKHDDIGFTLAKEFLTALQGKRWPKISIKNIISGIYGIVKLGVYRYMYSVLYISKNTEIHLQLDIEQHPDRNNCITLGEELDKYGRHVANIKWKISENDVKNAKFIAEKFLKKWSLIEDVRLNVFNKNQSVMKPYDTYHPVGTCCMGKNKESVVDENLKVWGLENLWVVSTGVLPSAGTANPTFTMLCLAERLTEQIIIEGCRVE